MAKSEQDSPDWVSIGVVGGTDRPAQESIKRVLKQNGIECMIEGSVVYGILVPRKQEGKARDLLRTSKELEGYWKQIETDNDASKRPDSPDRKK